MIQKIDFHIKELNNMKKYPKELYFIGNTSLLNKTKISIVGSRKPNQYAKQLIQKIVNKLSELEVCIVSGGAMGIDTIAHQSSNINNTIMIAGTGLDKRYPAINKSMICDIENNGLVLSQFEQNTPSLPRNFAIRNELIVALGDILIVAYADIKSGTTRSIEYALKMGKEIYVLPHRVGESEGTNKLLQDGTAKAIYDVDKFISKFGKIDNNIKDEFLEYCKTNPSYEDAILKNSVKVFEYELSGKIKIQNNQIIV